MNRRSFLKVAGASAMSLSLVGCAEGLVLNSAKSKKPNFIVIFTDDQGYADVGCYGARDFETPHLDKMAKEGVLFTDFYNGASLCSPSRAGLMTGCYPQRVGIPFVFGGNSSIGLNHDEITIAEVLKGQGYATKCIGKWHLGDHKQFLPLNHGFDEFFGVPLSNDQCSGTYPNSHWGPLALYDNEKQIEANPDQTQLTTRYTEKAVDFINRKKDQPFFIYLPHTMPHWPLGVSDKFKGKSKLGEYGDVIMEIDWSVGQIIEALKDNGVDDNTCVVFLSDNGPALISSYHPYSAYPLKEGKMTVYEGGQRVPCIMRWPDRIPKGNVCKEVATSMDFLPTFARLAGTTEPQDRIIDGKDIKSLMFNEPGAKSPHEAFFYYQLTQLEAVRSGKWKLHFPHMSKNVYVNGTDTLPSKTKWVFQEKALYDLERDPGEERNIIQRYPDVVKRLEAYAEEMRKDLGDKRHKWNVKQDGKPVLEPYVRDDIEGKNNRPIGRVKR